MTKLSIITINYNDASGLKATINSVVNQTFKDFEYIVIDGGSKDGSEDIIKENKRINYWVCEKDSGIYDAMNKGILQAKGEYLLFLNSGDYLVENTVLQRVFFYNFSEDICYGNMIINWGQGVLKQAKMPPEISLKHMYNDTLWHPISFIKRELFLKLGLYNTNYKLVADYDFFFKSIIVNKATTKQIDVDITVYNVDGVSSLKENKKVEKNERTRVLQSYLTMDEIKLLNKTGRSKANLFFEKIYNLLK